MIDGAERLIDHLIEDGGKTAPANLGHEMTADLLLRHPLQSCGVRRIPA
nr:hypothetical protein [Nocardia tenerifensis]